MLIGFNNTRRNLSRNWDHQPGKNPGMMLAGYSSFWQVVHTAENRWKDVQSPKYLHSNLAVYCSRKKGELEKNKNIDST
jgi:hypothetical protein